MSCCGVAGGRWWLSIAWARVGSKRTLAARPAAKRTLAARQAAKRGSGLHPAAPGLWVGGAFSPSRVACPRGPHLSSGVTVVSSRAGPYCIQQGWVGWADRVWVSWPHLTDAVGFAQATREGENAKAGCVALRYDGSPG